MKKKKLLMITIFVSCMLIGSVIVNVGLKNELYELRCRLEAGYYSYTPVVVPLETEELVKYGYFDSDSDDDWEMEMVEKLIDAFKGLSKLDIKAEYKYDERGYQHNIFSIYFEREPVK